MQLLLNIGFISLTSLFVSCSSSNKINTKPNYLNNVGDISVDLSKDDNNFNVCDESHIAQYFNFSLGLQYNGEMKKIKSTFKENYNYKKLKNENGLIRIRFVVNCKGKTGRFRILSMDNRYQPKQFDQSITSQLLQITKDLKDWKAQYSHKKPIDYYQYLIFKIKDGDIAEIMP